MKQINTNDFMETYNLMSAMGIFQSMAREHMVFNSELSMTGKHNQNYTYTISLEDRIFLEVVKKNNKFKVKLEYDKSPRLSKENVNSAVAAKAVLYVFSVAFCVIYNGFEERKEICHQTAWLETIDRDFLATIVKNADIYDVAKIKETVSSLPKYILKYVGEAS